MPVTYAKRGKKWRVIEADSRQISSTENGNPRDGGGHDSKDEALAQVRAINASLRRNGKIGKTVCTCRSTTAAGHADTCAAEPKSSLLAKLGPEERSDLVAKATAMLVAEQSADAFTLHLQEEFAKGHWTPSDPEDVPPIITNNQYPKPMSQTGHGPRTGAVGPPPHYVVSPPVHPGMNPLRVGILGSVEQPPAEVDHEGLQIVNMDLESLMEYEKPDVIGYPTPANPGPMSTPIMAEAPGAPSVSAPVEVGHPLDVFLVRHGMTVELTEDMAEADRPLSKKGRKRAKKAFKGLGALGVEFDAIHTSPADRCQETAELLAKECGGGPAEVEDVLSDGTPDFGKIMELIRGCPDGYCTAIVTHEPILGPLGTWLISGSIPPEHAGIKLGYAGVARISFEKERAPGRGKLTWVFMPRALRKLAK